jgi:outer membrane protein assembly factor BamE (lipoprotein component of BamABCDE complex)
VIAARVATVAFAAALSGCALMGPASLEEGGAGVMRANGPTPSVAQASVPPGSTKDQVAAALGRANVVRFDSGWEVWVYRWPGADRSTRGATELVVLFDAQGLVKKSRIRPGDRS